MGEHTQTETREADRIPSNGRPILTEDGRRKEDPLCLETPAGTLIGASPAMQEVRQAIHQIAPHDATVVIQGESGTGKELVAHLIHANSSRRSGPFVTVSCTSLCESMLESELFGHERGAFTGSAYRHRGKFERADGGTLFLDEIGSASPFLQQRLLRVIQERVFERVGGRQPLATDFRLVAATHVDLAEAVAAGDFREDLYYRLQVVHLALPPLRERREEIPELAEYFLGIYSKRFGKEVHWLPEGTMEALLDYPWPGNVRELQHVLQRAVLMARCPCIQPALLQLGASQEKRKEIRHGLRLEEALLDFERSFLRETLRQCGGNVTQTARQLGISRKGLYARISRCHIDPNPYRDEGTKETHRRMS